MAIYLVTGGAGFIGSNLVHQLVKDGHRVKVLDNFYSGKRENLWEVIHDIELIEGDLTDADAVSRAVAGVEIILHQGAVPSVPKSIKDPLTSDRVNVGGTLQILNAAVAHRVQRVVYAASSSAYGNTWVLPKTESMEGTPLSPYAVSKFTGELYCRVYNRIYGLETVSLRYFNVFGPRQDPNSEYAAVVPKLICSMMHDIPPKIYGDGTQSRDFTYIDNVVSANLLAANAPRLHGEVVNIGCGSRITLNKLVAEIAEIMQKTPESVYLKERMGDVKHSLADIQNAEALIGYKPLVQLKEGLEKTIEWYGRNLHE